MEREACELDERAMDRRFGKTRGQVGDRANALFICERGLTQITLERN
jgi:hypothetical protein